MCRTRSDTGGNRASIRILRTMEILGNDCEPSGPRSHFSLGEPDEAPHLRSRAVGVGGDPPGDLVPSPQVLRGTDVLFELHSSAIPILVMPEVQVAPVANRLHTIAAAHHHSRMPPDIVD